MAKFRRSVRVELMRQTKLLHDQGWSQRAIAKHLQVAQPTICQWLKVIAEPRTLQERIAWKIRAELVCCDIYQRMEDVYNEKDDTAWRALRHSSDYHDICFYGEWSARLAEEAK